MERPKGYREVAEDLEAFIASDFLSPGSLLPPERALQEHFGTSRTTLRRALQLLAEQGRLIPLPNRGMALPVAAPAKGRQTVVMIDGASLVHKKLFVEFSRLLNLRGIDLVHRDGEPENMEPALAEIAESDFDFAIIWPSLGYPKVGLVERLAERMPILCLNHEMRGFESRFDLAAIDNHEAGRLAAASLIEQGCRNIALTGMIDMLAWSHDRLAGYMKAHFDAGRSPEPRSYAFIATSGHNEADMAPLEWLLDQARPPDGILVMQDEYTAPVVSLLLSKGLRIPQDVRLVSIGSDHEVLVDGRPLPAVSADWTRFAGDAFDLLKDRLADPSAPPKKRTTPIQLQTGARAAMRSTSFNRVSPGSAATRRRHQ
jgi:LacI family transcriptional regulator